MNGKHTLWRVAAIVVMMVLAGFWTDLAGAKIAFVATDSPSSSGGNPDIWVMNDNGTGLAALVTDPALDMHPTWSPNGQKLAFLSDRGGGWAIHVINADGTGLYKVPNSDFGGPMLAESGLTLLDWSPDGQRLVYRATSDVGGMGVINADGTGKTILTTNGTGDGLYETIYDMNWGRSGDEITVALEGEYAWRKNIFRYTISTDTWTQMTFDVPPSHTFGPAVSSGGRIVFGRRASGLQLYDLYIMDDVPGAGSVNLTNLSTPEGAWRPDWMAGNSQVVFEYLPGSGYDWQIGVIDADGSDFNLLPRPAGLVAMDPTWVPEPATVGLVLAGLVGLVRRRRR